MNGYVRMAEPFTGIRPEPLPTSGVHRLVFLVERSDPTGSRRVIGRMVFRGYVPHTPGVPGKTPPAAPIPSDSFRFPEGAHLRPIGRLTPLSDSDQTQPALHAIPSGQAYRIISPTDRNLVAPALADVLKELFEQFAVRRGFTPQAPLTIALTRGYAAGDRGHGSGLAVDIASVGGRGFSEWKQDWDRAMTQSKLLPDPEARQAAMAAEASRNLGYQLYRVLMDHGGWRVFNNVVQLFGPWTERLGPWRRLHLEAPSDAQRQMMAEQERIFQAHQDHIHVAIP